MQTQSVVGRHQGGRSRHEDKRGRYDGEHIIGEEVLGHVGAGEDAEGHHHADEDHEGEIDAPYHGG